MMKSVYIFLMTSITTLLLSVNSYAAVGKRCEINQEQLHSALYHLVTGSDKLEQLRDYIKTFPTWKYLAYEIDGLIYHIDFPDRIKKHLLDGKQWEPKEAALMSDYVREGDVALDVGAHIGIHTMHLCSLVGSTGRVIAIEPQMKLYRELFYNLTVNGFENVSLFHNAIGNTGGRVELGPYDMSNEGSRQCGKGGKEYVELCTIDALNLEHLDFMKIEVNGMEFQALQGAEKTIERCRPKILIELWHPIQCSEWLKEHQYVVVHCDGDNYFALPVELVSEEEEESLPLPAAEPEEEIEEE